MAMIYLIRHGQASFLKSDYDQLSELGKQQSEVLGQALKDRNQKAVHLVRGTMKRHQQTADHCLSSFEETQNIELDGRWNEYNHMELLAKHNPAFTDYMAIPMKVLQQLLNESIRDWLDDKHDYSTSWQTFNEGVLDALSSLSAKLEKGQTAWVFTSGGLIAVVLMELLALSDKQFIDLQAGLVNSSVTKILVGKSRLSLSTHNEHSHLDHNVDFITYR